MAIIYQKTVTTGTANGVILDPRQALIYPFDLGDWTKIRIGMILGYTSSSQNNANMDNFGSASVAVSNDRDRIYYGVKRAGSSFPTENNDAFVGFKSYGNLTSVGFPQTFFDHRNEHGAFGYIGVHHPNSSVSAKLYDSAVDGAFAVVEPSAQNDELGNYAGLLTLYLEVVNKGQANQQLIVRYYRQQITDTSQSAVKAAMIGANLETQGTFDFHLSGTPHELPNSFFIYNPIATIRTRVFGLATILEE